MTLRDYRASDLESCVAIVNEAWDFDGQLHPQSLADFVKRLYTAGTLAESRQATVIETDGEVQAFLFGRAGARDLYRNEYSGVPGRMRVLIRFLSLPGAGPIAKFGWLRAIAAHQIARHRVEPIGDGEVTLFAAATESQGRGYGRQLMDAYVEQCRQLGVERLTLETDVESSYCWGRLRSV
jgi:GNAT superfamily N-acetyltransferase